MPSHLPPEARERLAEVLRASLRTAREGAALTQEKLAGRIGLSTSTYRRIERGLMSPGLPTLRKLCQVLCLSLDELVGPECAGTVRRAARPSRRKRPASASAPRARPASRTQPSPLPSFPQVYPLVSRQPWELLAAVPRLPVTDVLPLLLVRRGMPLALVVDVG